MADDNALGWTDENKEAIRDKYFALSDNPRWGRPGHGLVSTSLASSIQRRSRNTHDCEDVFQTVYADLYHEFFETVETGFLPKTDRAHTVRNFESWFRTVIQNRVFDEFRKISRQRRPLPLGPGLEGPRKVDDDPERVATLRSWLNVALGELSPGDRELLEQRYMDSKKTGVLAADANVTTAALSRKLWSLKLRCRNRMEELVAADYLPTHLDEAELFRPLIEGRCSAGHLCYMYRVHCPKARTPGELAVELGLGTIGDGTAEAAVTERLKRFEAVVSGALREWGLNAALDQCIWAD